MDPLSKEIRTISCAYIAVRAQSQNDFAYVKGKHFHSINIQVICDAQMSLTNIVAQWPGSTYGSFIMQTSSVRNRHLDCVGWLTSW